MKGYMCTKLQKTARHNIQTVSSKSIPMTTNISTKTSLNCTHHVTARKNKQKAHQFCNSDNISMAQND